MGESPEVRSLVAYMCRGEYLAECYDSLRDGKEFLQKNDSDHPLCRRLTASKDWAFSCLLVRPANRPGLWQSALSVEHSRHLWYSNA
jgi:hypothetical protein